MRTIRTKVYYFSELNEQAKQTAIIEEAKRFSQLFGFSIKDVSDYLQTQIKNRLSKNEYEFKADGTRF